MAGTKISAGETKRLVNFLRRLGFIKSIRADKNHLFSANFTLETENFTEKFITIGMIILPAIEEIKKGEKNKIEIEKNTLKNIDEKDLREFSKLLPNVMKGITVYLCPTSENIIIRAEKPPPK